MSVSHSQPQVAKGPHPSLAWAPVWEPELCLDYKSLSVPIKSVLFKHTRAWCADSRYPLNCHAITCSDSKQIISYVPLQASFSKEGIKHSVAISFLCFLSLKFNFFPQFILLSHSFNMVKFLKFISFVVLCVKQSVDPQAKVAPVAVKVLYSPKKITRTINIKSLRGTKKCLPKLTS